jgi:hypothetical protein
MLVSKLARGLCKVTCAVSALVLTSCDDGSMPFTESESASPAATTPIPITMTALNAGYRANEPLGYSLISDRPFDAKVENGWRDRGDPEFSITSDSEAPVSPLNVGKATYPAGWAGGAGPINTWIDLMPARKKLYVSFWLKFSSNWVGHPTGMNKVIHFWIGGSNRIVFKALGAGSSSLTARFTLQSINQSPSTITLMPNTSNTGTMTRGSWHHIEIALAANTLSNRDGKLAWWVDGQKIGDYSNLSFVNKLQAHKFTTVSWNPTWGGIGGVMTHSQDEEIDEVYLSGK